MYSRGLSRAARSSSPIPTLPTPCHRVAPTAFCASPSTTSHQRRPSSSKTSCPPGGNRGSEQPAGNASTTASEGEKPAAAETEKKSTTRLSRRKPKDEAAEMVKARDEAFANIPAVPSTRHLQLADVAVSSFFSLHRPISVTRSIPPQASTQSFNAIFDTPKSNSSHKPVDVIYTISNAVSSLEDGSRKKSEENDLRREILANSSSNAEPEQITHLNGQPVQNLEDLVRAFRPFNTPPAPVPFDEHGRPEVPGNGKDKQAQILAEQQQAEAADAETSHQRPPLEQHQSSSNETTKTYTRMYTSTFSVKETVHPSGQKTYAAYGSPLRRGSVRAARSNGRAFALPNLNQQYLGRIMSMQKSYEDSKKDGVAEDGRSLDSVEVGASQAADGAQRAPMEAISVKRQRKLKMKKHKYKKLMRRTRNLRKREGRL